jgi:hypothetical protein
MPPEAPGWPEVCSFLGKAEGADPMKVTSVLLQQHRHFEYLLAALEADPRSLLPLWADISRQLDAHLRAKREVFYPAVAALEPALVLDRYEEHALCALDLESLRTMDPRSPVFAERVHGLRHMLAGQIRSDEEVLFPHVEALFPKQKLIELGLVFSDTFDRLVRENDVDLLLRSTPPTPRRAFGSVPVGLPGGSFSKGEPVRPRAIEGSQPDLPPLRRPLDSWSAA